MVRLGATSSSVSTADGAVVEGVFVALLGECGGGVSGVAAFCQAVRRRRDLRRTRKDVEELKGLAR